jgi:hypothetical protein
VTRGLYAVGATSPAARYRTDQHTSLRADRRTFVLRFTPDQIESRYQAANVESARRRNETKTLGLTLPIGGEW